MAIGEWSDFQLKI